MNDTLIPYNLYARILKNIPEDKIGSVSSFLDIANIPYNENAISSIYAYFFDPNEDHQLGHTFLNALNDLLDDDIFMSDFEVTREKSTIGGGRIDILLEEDTKDPVKKIVIIENKIYHTPENPFDDYLNSYSGNNTTGVILGLKKIDAHNKFKSITHKELINSVSNRVGEVIDEVPAKYLIILQDFMYHMKQFDKRMEAKSYEFIFNEGDNINKLLDLQAEIFYDVVEQIKEGAEASGWKHSRTSGWEQAISTTDDLYVLYFHLEGLFSKHELELKLHIKGTDNVEIWNGQDYHKRTNDVADLHHIVLVDEPSKDIKYAHTASKKYKIENYEELRNFTQKVEHILTNEWNPLLEKFKTNFRF
jgi:hypothetical protein